MKRDGRQNEGKQPGRSLDGAKGTPVRGGKNEGPKGDAWARLTRTMDGLGAEAAANGLTADRLDALLVDES